MDKLAVTEAAFLDELEKIALSPELLERAEQRARQHAETLKNVALLKSRGGHAGWSGDAWRAAKRLDQAGHFSQAAQAAKQRLANPASATVAKSGLASKAGNFLRRIVGKR